VSAQSYASTRDIFTNTNKTRRIANSKESAQAIEVGSGCAGFLLAPNVGMSAAHCTRAGDEIRSSVALRDDLPADGKVGRTLESGAAKGFDLWIFEIVWEKPPYPKGIKIVSHVQVQKGELIVGDNNTAEAIYTVGFPADISNGKLVLAWGYGKTDGEDGKLKYNISVINGNSGGGVFRLKDKMLVSLVSGGPHRFGEDGWKENDWNDEKHWNWGPSIWKYYPQSKALQTLYPRGFSMYYKKSWDFEMLPSFGFDEFEPTPLVDVEDILN
jgi:V8-like Glu-specific endopeptidase